MFDKKLVMSIVIITAISMMMINVVTQQVNAAPKDQKINSHCKDRQDSDTGEVEFKCNTNSNGPDGHSNCKFSLDDGEFESRCKSN